MRIPHNVHNTNEENDAGHMHAVNESPEISALFVTPEQVRHQKRRQLRVLYEAIDVLDALGHAGKHTATGISYLYILTGEIVEELTQGSGTNEANL